MKVGGGAEFTDDLLRSGERSLAVGTARVEGEFRLASIIIPPLTRRGCPCSALRSACEPYVGELVMSRGEEEAVQEWKMSLLASDIHYSLLW